MWTAAGIVFALVGGFVLGVLFSHDVREEIFALRLQFVTGLNTLHAKLDEILASVKK